MPIVVEHPGSSPALDALLALVVNGSRPPGPTQPPQPPPPQSPVADILSQLAPLAQPPAPPSAPLPSDNGSAQFMAQAVPVNGAPPMNGAALPQVINGSAAPSYQPHQPRYASYQQPSAAAGGYDKLANQDYLAQFEAQKQQQLQDSLAQHTADHEAQVQGALNERWAFTRPPGTEAAVVAGTHALSPQQLRSIEDDQAKIVALDARPDWTTQQKEQGKSQLYGHIHQTYSNPQFVPPEKREKTPQQQFEESLVTHTDPVTGKQTQGIMGMRNGVPEFKPITPKADPAELEDQKQTNRIALEQVKVANKPPKLTPAQQATKQVDMMTTSAQVHSNEMELHDAKKKVEDAEKNRKLLQSKWDNTTEDLAKSDPKNDQLKQEYADAWKAEVDANQHFAMVKQRHDKYIEDARSAIQSAYEAENAPPAPDQSQIPPDQTDMGAPPSALSDPNGDLSGAPPDAAQPMPPDAQPQQVPQPQATDQPSAQQPAWESMPEFGTTDMPPGQMQNGVDDVFMQPGPTQPVIRYRKVTSREDIKKLDKGTKFILPDGRTGTRQ